MYDRARFERDGFLQLPGFLSRDDLKPFHAEISALGRKPVASDFDLFGGSSHFTPENQSLFYDALRYLPCVYRLSASTKIVELCRALGLDFPCVMGSCNMRMDRPNDAKHLFRWHQDTLYLLGSSNAVTIWVPLGKVDRHHGSVGVIPGSHQDGVYPFRKISDKEVTPHVPLLQRDLSLDHRVDERQEVVIEGDAGDVFVFYQMLLHRSHPNLSDKIRWTCQIRMADLFEEEFIRNRYPMGERTNIYHANYRGGRRDP